MFATIPAPQILSAIKNGDLESIRDNGTITILIHPKPILTLLAEPVPQVRITADDRVQILSGDNIECSIQAADHDDAEEIADAISGVIEFAG